MAAYRAYGAVCDGCGTVTADHFDFGTMREAGWVIDGDETQTPLPDALCPDCADHAEENG